MAGVHCRPVTVAVLGFKMGHGVAGQDGAISLVSSAGPDSGGLSQKLLHEVPEPAEAQAATTMLDSTLETAISSAAQASASSVPSTGKQADEMTRSTQQKSCQGTSHGGLPSNEQGIVTAESQLGASGTDSCQALASSRQEAIPGCLRLSPGNEAAHSSPDSCSRAAMPLCTGDSGQQRDGPPFGPNQHAADASDGSTASMT